MRDANDEVVAISQCEGNLYQIIFREVYEVDAAKFMRSRAEGVPMKLWHS